MPLLFQPVNAYSSPLAIFIELRLLFSPQTAVADLRHRGHVGNRWSVGSTGRFGESGSIGRGVFEWGGLRGARDEIQKRGADDLAQCLKPNNGFPERW